MLRRNVSRTLLTAAAAFALSALPAAAQGIELPGGGALEPFGGGYSPERQLKIQVQDGPFEVVTGKFTLPQGGQIDWHGHPGTGVITVTAGTFEEFREDGCVVLHGPGSVFFEVQGQVHRVANASANEAAEGLITFFVPVGGAPVAFVPPPPNKPCMPGTDPGPSEEETASLEAIQAAVEANADSVARIQDLLIRMARALSLKP